jgi:hypothetical protein
MPLGNALPLHSDAEALLASLEGVLSAHVVASDNGQILEVHILAVNDLHPKQVVRNVESALSAGLGITIDRRLVSVAQVRTPGVEPSSNGHAPARPAGATSAAGARPDPDRESDPEPDPQSAPQSTPVEAVPDAGRLEFVRYEARREGDVCTCEVLLRGRSREFVGRGTGGDTAGGRATAAARAVMDAITRARPELRLELDGATLSSSRGRTFVIVGAHLLFDRDTLRLAGAAALTRSPEEAAILAALQATNRWSG